jgi:hypothetical protein
MSVAKLGGFKAMNEARLDEPRLEPVRTNAANRAATRYRD